MLRSLARTKAAAVEFKGFLALALKQAAIKKNSLAVYLKQMLRAGNGLRRAVKSQFHGYAPVLVEIISAQHTRTKGKTEVKIYLELLHGVR